jgi:DNA-binding transcriptional MocR family regulator
MPVFARFKLFLYGAILLPKHENRHFAPPPRRPGLAKPFTYQELAAKLEADIRSGVYAPGSCLPPQRQLAEEMGINVSTVSRSYRELQLSGLVIGSKRRGSMVTGGAMPHVPAVGPSHSNGIDLTVNRPATRDYLDQLALTMAVLPKDPRFVELQEYQPPQGPSWARAAGAKWMAAPGFEPDPENVVVTSGAQHALYAVMNSLMGIDGAILADRLTYYGLKALAPVFHFEIVGVTSDAQGMLPEVLERECAARKVKAIFIVPNFQNPTVVVMSLERRAALAEIARRHDVQIIEDDVYGPLVDQRLPPLASLCPERTYHISSTSKLLAPGLRLGFLATPPHRAAIAAEAVRTTAWMPAPISMLIASLWIENGITAQLLAAQRKELKYRHDLAHGILNGAQISSDPACMFIWLVLPAPWRADDFAANAKARGVSVMPASAFAVDRSESEHGVRINLSSASSREDLIVALKILAETLNDRPRALYGNV